MAMELHPKWNPPLSRRALQWLLLNAVGAPLHVYASRPLWIPPEAKGQIHYSGPGDWLIFSFLVFWPAVAFGVMNVAALYWVVRSTLRRRSAWPVLAYVFVIGLWTAALLFEQQQLSGIRGGS